MDNKKIIVTAFFLIALVQLYVPAKMIWNREDILNTGTAYKFQTAPVDPNDPFIGKYITLNYDENTFPVPNEQDWKPGEPIYVSLQTDTNGFVKIASISKIKPSDNNDFIKAKVRFLSGNDSNILTIEYPFDRFYMEESKAYDAELAYSQFQRDTSNPTYALVSIKNGEAVLKDVMIGGTSIKEMVKSNQKER